MSCTDWFSVSTPQALNIAYTYWLTRHAVHAAVLLLSGPSTPGPALVNADQHVNPNTNPVHSNLQHDMSHVPL